jgi:hypothetical protein
MAARPKWVAAVVVASAIIWVLASNEVIRLRAGEPLLREFMAFYTVGHLLNTSPDALFRSDAFLRTYHELFPFVPASTNPPYAHAPFEAVLFRPFALLSFERALVAWQILSLALIAAGVTLLWRASDVYPERSLAPALLLALSFYPVSVASISRGQVSAVTFFWLAVAIWCQRHEREICSGLALAPCLAKPTLLVLLIPMLLAGRRFRMLAGFAGGAGILGAASLLAVGVQGCVDYARVIFRFGSLATAAGPSFALQSEYVDLNTFARMIGASRAAAMIVLMVGAAGVLPYLWKIWRVARQAAGSDMAWASTLTWTMVLNAYTPMYDTSVVVLGVLLMGGALYRTYRGRVPRMVQALFVVLYVVPWLPPLAMRNGRTIQLYTMVLILLGIYQIWLAMRSDWGTVFDRSQPSRLTASAVASR